VLRKQKPLGSKEHMEEVQIQLKETDKLRDETDKIKADLKTKIHKDYLIQK
jgi:hypothetical protein